MTDLLVQVTLGLLLLDLIHGLFLNECYADWAVMRTHIRFLLHTTLISLFLILKALLLKIGTIEVDCCMTSLTLCYGELAPLLERCLVHILFLLKASFLDTQVFFMPLQSLFHAIFHRSRVELSNEVNDLITLAHEHSWIRSEMLRLSLRT